jgi:predicted Zn-dependent protease
MARGFESKGSAEYAEERIEEARKRARPSAGDVERGKKREELELMRSRLTNELDATTSDMRRNSLAAALKHVDGEIAKLGR